MKKQSILNLVNSILLLCTLLFSVISFAWYSPNKDVGTPLSFGAGGTGSLLLNQLALTDEGTVLRDHTIETGAIVNGVVKPYLGRGSFPLDDNDSISADTVLEFGTIDDLGYLKDSNAIYYCVTVPYSNGDSKVNLSYSTDNFEALDESFGDSKYPFSLYHLDDDNKIVAFSKDTHDEAVTAETKQNSNGRYIAFEAVKSYHAPGTLEATDILKMFPRHDDESVSDSNRPEKHSILSLADSDTPEKVKGSAHEVNLSALDTETPADANEYYIYIKIYPDLDNYHALAELMMDHMPFYTAFDLKLYVEVNQ